MNPLLILVAVIVCVWLFLSPLEGREFVLLVVVVALATVGSIFLMGDFSALMGLTR